MSVEKVKEYFKQWNRDKDIVELQDKSSATVELAAEALGVVNARIAKTISFRGTEENTCILIVTAGDSKIDNSKFKNEFSLKPRMLTFDEAFKFTGHEVGGVCPFAIENTNVKIYTDVSLKRFETVFPACGSSNSLIELTPEELFDYSKSIKWVDVSKYWD